METGRYDEGEENPFRSSVYNLLFGIIVGVNRDE